MSENISIDEVCCLLEALDEWEEVALHLGFSDQTIQEIRGLSGGNSLRRKVMVSKWVQRERVRRLNKEEWSLKERRQDHRFLPLYHTLYDTLNCGGGSRNRSSRIYIMKMVTIGNEEGQTEPERKVYTSKMYKEIQPATAWAHTF
jgi:hypothetical protein